jgi:hypothetical protein
VGRKEGGCAGRMLLYTVAFFSSTRGHALGEGRREKGRASGRERVRLVTNFSEYMCQSPDSARYPKRERERARARARAGQTGWDRTASKPGFRTVSEGAQSRAFFFSWLQ